MIRIEITLGLLTTIATVALIAVYGIREEERMVSQARAFNVRSVERGAEMYEQFCADCHGFNAVGSMCPPLNQYSGLHGGSVGAGIAWRMEELGLDRTAVYEYVYGAIASGRSVSTRPFSWAGNRIPADSNVMAMPAWSQENGGPLRPDQIHDLTNYIVAFEDFLPDDPTEAADQVAAWLADPSIVMVSMNDAPEPNPRPENAAQAVLGAWLFENLACHTCHALDGVSVAPVGPPLDNMATIALARVAADDYTGTADSAAGYIRESIVTPAAHIVEGYEDEAQMPAIFGSLPEEDLAALIAFLLGDEATTGGEQSGVLDDGDESDTDAEDDDADDEDEDDG